MSERVDFYLLNRTDPGALIHYTCRLLAKAWQAGLRVFVLTESEQQAHAIDGQLWTLSDTSFVPHALAEKPHAGDRLTRICIGGQLPDPAHFDMLVNLKNSATPGSDQFARVAEVVDAADAHVADARLRYGAWRASGAQRNFHPIKL